MKSKKFVGIKDVTKATPSGGAVTVAFGDLIFDDDTKSDSLAIQIVDKESNIVAQFAMLPATFGILLECIKELYEHSE